MLLPGVYGQFLSDAGLLLLAWVLGGMVGWQREVQGRAAGVRTHMLVAGGSCLVTLVSFGGMGDPGRIAAQVVTGIGFLGAGVILRRGVSIHGLTTAASIWVVAGIGIASGAGGRFAALAVVATLLSLFTLTLIKRIESAIRFNPRDATLSVALPRDDAQALGKVVRAITQAGAQIVGYEPEEPDTDEDGTLSGGNGKRGRVRFQLRLPQDLSPDLLTQALTESLPNASLEWE